MVAYVAQTIECAKTLYLLENNINYILKPHLPAQVFRLNWFFDDQVITSSNLIIPIYLIKIKHKVI